MLSSTRSKCGDHLLRLRAAKSPQGRRQTPQYSEIWLSPLAKFLRRKTNSTVLPLDEERKDWPEFGQVLCAPPPGPRSCGPQMWGEQMMKNCTVRALPRWFFCVWLGLPHGGSCGSRPGFLLPSSPASPRSSWASLLLKGLSRRALDLEAGLAENGGVGGVLGPTMGVRDFEVAPLFTMQTRFCSKP